MHPRQNATECHHFWKPKKRWMSISAFTLGWNMPAWPFIWLNGFVCELTMSSLLLTMVLEHILLLQYWMTILPLWRSIFPWLFAGLNCTKPSMWWKLVGTNTQKPYENFEGCLWSTSAMQGRKDSLWQLYWWSNISCEHWLQSLSNPWASHGPG